MQSECSPRLQSVSSSARMALQREMRAAGRSICGPFRRKSELSKMALNAVSVFIGGRNQVAQYLYNSNLMSSNGKEQKSGKTFSASLENPFSLPFFLNNLFIYLLAIFSLSSRRLRMKNAIRKRLPGLLKRVNSGV